MSLNCLTYLFRVNQRQEHQAPVLETQWGGEGDRWDSRVTLSLKQQWRDARLTHRSLSGGSSFFLQLASMLCIVSKRLATFSTGDQPMGRAISQGCCAVFCVLRDERTTSEYRRANETVRVYMGVYRRFERVGNNKRDFRRL